MLNKIHIILYSIVPIIYILCAYKIFCYCDNVLSLSADCKLFSDIAFTNSELRIKSII